LERQERGMDPAPRCNGQEFLPFSQDLPFGLGLRLGVWCHQEGNDPVSGSIITSKRVLR